MRGREAAQRKTVKPAWPRTPRVWISYLVANDCYQEDGHDLARHCLLQRIAGRAGGKISR